jgi:iron complex outermembrane receptor protein
MKSHILLLSASVLTLAWCNTAQAQTASPAPNTDSSTTIETVVVTAERRNEDLMKTPISADVLTAEDIANKGVTSVDDLQFVAPSVTVDNFGQGIDFNIRGIGKGSEHQTQFATGVITYRDNAATFPGYFTEEPYYDIASIEVLRGPQGTFVGQNATGGAVFVTSNNPVIGGDYDGYAQGQFGNYDDTAVQGAVNIPISDTFAMRIALDGESRGSFYSILDRNPTDNCPNDKYAGCKPGYNPGDLNYGAGRVSFLWKPTDALTVSFKIDGDYLDNGGYPADDFSENFKSFGTIPNPNYHDLFHITANAPQVGLDRFTRAILRMDYLFPDGITLRSVSSYQNGNTNYTADLDGTDLGGPANGFANNFTFFDRVDETAYSQEFNLISPDNQRLTWVFGAYGQSDRVGWEKPYQFLIGVPAGNIFSQYSLQGSTPNAAWAVFGQVGYNVTSNFQVQLGSRWSMNSSHNDVDILQYGTPLVADEKTKSYSLDYKASLNWTLNDTNFLYAFAATGYKPGGLNTPVGLGPAAPFGPERIMNYETGWKAELFGGHVRSTIDAYYNDYKNFQVTIGYPLFPTFGDGVNDPNATKIYGLEGEFDAVFGNLSFGAGLGLMHSALGQFWASDSRITSVTIACNPLTGPAVIPDSACTNVGGHPTSYAPSVSGNLSAQYIFNLPGGDTLTPRANYAYESGQWATMFDNAGLGDRLGVRNLLGAQLEWKHETFVLTLYGTNLTDEHYVAALNSNLTWAGPPRQFGIRLLKLF